MPKLKMSQEHFEALAMTLESFLAKSGRPLSFWKAQYADRGFTPKRLRWDLLHASKFDTKPLYDAGLHDPHIDSALTIIIHGNGRYR